MARRDDENKDILGVIETLSHESDDNSAILESSSQEGTAPMRPSLERVSGCNFQSR